MLSIVPRGRHALQVVQSIVKSITIPVMDVMLGRDCAIGIGPLDAMQEGSGPVPEVLPVNGWAIGDLVVSGSLIDDAFGSHVST